MMRFSEALLLGAISQPLCHGSFFGKSGSGGLLAAAVRACGRDPKTTAEVVNACFELWPWLLERNACPPLSQIGLIGVEHMDWSEESFAEAPQIRSAALCWIIGHFDGEIRIEWIASQVAALEEHIVNMAAFGQVMQAVRERQSQLVNGGSPHVLAIASPTTDSGLQPAARHSRSLLEDALEAASVERHLWS